MLLPLTTLTYLWKVNLWRKDTSSFFNTQSIYHSLSSKNNFFPKSPHKNAEVIEKLVVRCKVKFSFKNSAHGRPHKDSNEEETRWLIEFPARADLTYTSACRKDNVYIGKENCECIYKQRFIFSGT